jgi:hypothetical protein
VAKGEIKEVSYLGDISIFHILLANGRLIRVSRSNRSRWDQDISAVARRSGKLSRLEPLCFSPDDAHEVNMASSAYELVRDGMDIFEASLTEAATRVA